MPQLERPCSDGDGGGFQLVENRGYVYIPVLRSVGTKTARRLLKLPFATDLVAASGLVPGDGDVDEPLEEIALLGRGRAPGVLQLLVCGEELTASDQVESAL